MQLPNEIEQLLYRVEKPGRYVGGEYNQTVKDWDSVDLHIALAFPDIYDLGQPNLGLAILYDLLNQAGGIAAERVFSPWLDMEAAMRSAGLPLFSLENKRPIRDFDILGITLPYESIYTNVLNLLDLAGIPLYSRERTKAHPLVIAGGQACFNPETMADFIDAFVIGEGEEVFIEIAEAYRAWKKSGGERGSLLESLSEIQGVYVPEFYEVAYQEDGRIASISPTSSIAPKRVRKRIVAQLPPPVTRFLVPNVGIVHDRIAIEIMRGCTRGCRFCHAGVVNRPVRQRPVAEIVDAMEAGLQATGYQQVGLLSLSSSDHTQIIQIVDAVYERFKERRVQVSLPSLRIASFSVDLMQRLQTLRPGGGFTLAPEAATPRMRAVINKELDEAELLETARQVFERGWLSLKLYFMIGLPGETMDDVLAIAELGKKIQRIGWQARGKRISVHLGVGSFIPKPHTPFQWAATDSSASLMDKINALKDALRKTGIKLSYNHSDSTLLESWLSRGDRSLGQVIHAAWRNGAKFDAWNEHFNIDAWQKAFESVGIDPAFYAHRSRDLDEVLPWDHIDIGVNKQFLRADWLMSQRGQTRDDCRDGCFHCGILDAFSEVQPLANEYYWGCP